MQKTWNWFDRLLWALCIALVALMSAAVIVSVIMRYVLSITFVWAEELITMLFISTTLFGAVMAVKENEHIGISVFVDTLPSAAKKALAVFELLVVSAVQVIMLRTSLSWITQTGDTLTPGLRLPIRLFYAMLPASAVLIIVYLARKAVGAFRRGASSGAAAAPPV